MNLPNLNKSKINKDKTNHHRKQSNQLNRKTHKKPTQSIYNLPINLNSQKNKRTINQNTYKSRKYK
jgi:hypothetical protein